MWTQWCKCQCNCSDQRSGSVLLISNWFVPVRCYGLKKFSAIQIPLIESNPNTNNLDRLNRKHSWHSNSWCEFGTKIKESFMYNIFQDIQNYYTSRTIEPSKLFIEKIMRVTGPSKVCKKMTICQRLEVVQELTETMFKNYKGKSISLQINGGSYCLLLRLHCWASKIGYK